MISVSRGTTRERTNSRVTRRISAKSSGETWEGAAAAVVTSSLWSQNGTVRRGRAVVIGAGIGGLAAAAGLCAAGWEVTACERAASLEPVGAGLALGPNGLRALDVLGAGDALRKLAVTQELGVRRADGRWLTRSSSGRMIAERFGDPVILVLRAAVVDALAARVPAGVLSLATEVTSVAPGGKAAARVATTAGELA